MTFWTDSSLSLAHRYARSFHSGVSVCAQCVYVVSPSKISLLEIIFATAKWLQMLFIEFLLWKCDRKRSAPDSGVLIIFLMNKDIFME